MSLTPKEIDALEAKIYPHRRATYAKEFAALRAGRQPHPLSGGEKTGRPRSAKHGSVWMYKGNGCRCQACRDAIAQATAARRKRKASP